MKFPSQYLQIFLQKSLTDCELNCGVSKCWIGVHCCKIEFCILPFLIDFWLILCYFITFSFAQGCRQADGARAQGLCKGGGSG